MKAFRQGAVLEDAIKRRKRAAFLNSAVRAVIEPLHNAGLLAVCSAVELEVLRSVRSKADAERIGDEMRTVPAALRLRPGSGSGACAQREGTRWGDRMH